MGLGDTPSVVVETVDLSCSGKFHAVLNPNVQTRHTELPQKASLTSPSLLQTIPQEQELLVT